MALDVVSRMALPQNLVKLEQNCSDAQVSKQVSPLVSSSSNMKSDFGEGRSHSSSQMIKISNSSSSYSSKMGKESEKYFRSSMLFSDLPLGFSLMNNDGSATGARVVVLFFGSC